MERISKSVVMLAVVLALLTITTLGLSELSKQDLYDMGKLKPMDSVLKVKVGQPAPDFLLPSVSGKQSPVTAETR